MITLEDARGCTISLPKPPRRIVSLVPSQTELLSSLGLDEEVVGITRFCEHPVGWRDSKMIVGGTKLLRADRIRELRPDLIFANLEENGKADVEEIEAAAPVFVTNVRTLEEAIDMIESVALLVGRVSEGARIVTAISDAFEALYAEIGVGAPLPPITDGTQSHSVGERLQDSIRGHLGESRRSSRATGRGGLGESHAGGRTAKSGRTPTSNGDTAILRAAYLIWRDPYMSVGGDTFIHDILARGGFLNVFDAERRYPKVSIADLVEANPDVVFLSSEPFPFLEKHVPELETALPGAQVKLVDGQLFSWYGSRLIHTPDYLRQVRSDLGLT